MQYAHPYVDAFPQIRLMCTDDSFLVKWGIPPGCPKTHHGWGAENRGNPPPEDLQDHFYNVQVRNGAEKRRILMLGRRQTPELPNYSEYTERNYSVWYIGSHASTTAEEELDLDRYEIPDSEPEVGPSKQAEDVDMDETPVASQSSLLPPAQQQWQRQHSQAWSMHSSLATEVCEAAPIHSMMDCDDEIIPDSDPEDEWGRT